LQDLNAFRGEEILTVLEVGFVPQDETPVKKLQELQRTVIDYFEALRTLDLMFLLLERVYRTPRSFVTKDGNGREVLELTSWRPCRLGHDVE
jgi:hypothetical protein